MGLVSELCRGVLRVSARDAGARPASGVQTVRGTPALMRAGVLGEGVLSEGVLSEGVLGEGVLSEGALSEGVLSEGV